MSALGPFHKMVVALLEAGNDTKFISLVVTLPENEYWSVMAEVKPLLAHWPHGKPRVILARAKHGSNFTGAETPADMGVLREVFLPDLPSFGVILGGIHFTFIKGPAK